MELGDEAELHFTYISAVECRKRNVSIDAMERLANALDMELWELLRKAK